MLQTVARYHRIMAQEREPRDAILRGIHVLDGGMATELEFQGACLDGPLWSAQLLEDAPEKVQAVHRAYIEAGAECILTASYQVSRMGYAEMGLDAERADAALLRSVELARGAAEEFAPRRIVVAASLGPYGAALHSGAEYHGNYACTFAELAEFHRQRIAVLAAAPNAATTPDLLAFETLPSLEEARAIGAALAEYAQLAAWFSFTCKDARRVAHGEPLRACAAAVAEFPQTVAVGVNCTHPGLISSLLGELRGACEKPIVVYPNSGEGWNQTARSWTGSSAAARFGQWAADWLAEGAQMVGGCCRTRPTHIRQVAEAVRRR